MVVKLREYESAEEITKGIDSEISKAKSTLGEYLRRLDEIRNLAERSKKIREAVFKLAGKKVDQTSLGEINVGDLNIEVVGHGIRDIIFIDLDACLTKSLAIQLDGFSTIGSGE